MAKNTAVVRKPNERVTVPVDNAREEKLFTPLVDIIETGDELVFHCDMPGVTKDDVELKFEKGELSIHGRVRGRQSPRNAWLMEYDIGDFYRTFALNDAIDSEKIHAELKNGVLTVHLPKREEVKPKRIAIQGD